MNVALDTNVNIGQIGVILTMLCSIVVFTWRQSGSYAAQVASIRGLTDRMASVEAEMRKQTEILIKLGQQDAQISSSERRLDSAETRLSEVIAELGRVKVQHAIDSARGLREAGQINGARA